MKRFLIFTTFLFSSLIIFFRVFAAVDVSDSDSYVGLVEQGWNISCLASSPTEDFDTNHVPGNHTVQINLNGQCQSGNGCYLVICQGTNEQYYEDQARLEECANHNSFETLPPENSWEGGRTWGDWCAHVEEQMGDTFESAQGCRSGVAQLDAILPNSSDETIPTAEINSTGGYHFAPGLIETVITLNNAYDHIPYQFYAFGQGGKEALGAGGAEGEENSQQQGQINDFEFGAEGNISKCVTITWDPYGRVFDSQSLEPIPDVQVNLLDENKKPASQITKNYDITTSNGVFNIQVEKQGTYYMSVNPPSTHEFKTDPKLNQNYKYIYSDLYYPDKSFFEKAGTPTHHDIPLNPLGTPFHSDIIVYPQSLSQMDMGGSVKFEGKVSHPLARVCLIGEISKKQYSCSQADKIGQFQIFINKSSYPLEALLIKTTKVDPNNINQYFSQSISVGSDSQEASLKYEPLIKYIEGYIYDDQGKTLSNTEVLIKLKTDNKTVGRFKSDEKGYVKVLSSNLPLFDYYLEANSDNKSVKINTSNFIDKNKTYFEEKNINPMIDRALDGTVKNYPDKAENNNILPNNKTVKSKINLNNFNMEVFILLFIIIVMVIISIGVLIYIKRNSSLDKIK